MRALDFEWGLWILSEGWGERWLGARGWGGGGGDVSG